jgi:hypothetical protein
MNDATAAITAMVVGGADLAAKAGQAQVVSGAF